MAVAPSQASRRRERGSTLTEAAFVTFPFFFIIFGIMEMGFLFRNYLTVSNTAAEASRAASVYGSNEDADYQILQSAKHGIAAMGAEQLDFIVIWRASGPGDTVPTACFPANGGTQGPYIGGGGSGSPDPATQPAYDPTVIECNTYRNGDLFLALEDSAGNPTDTFGCKGLSGSRDMGWCPIIRFDAVSDPPDYVGIYVQSEHRYLTGFLKDTSTLTST